MSDSPVIAPLKDSNAEIIQPKRNRGGQAGNKNATRHGFYARNLGVISPSKLDEFELRNLMGEVAMLKDYMVKIYNRNLDSDDPIILAETLRALSLAGVAVSRLLLVHNQVRITRSGSNSTLKDLLADMNTASSRAGRLSASVNHSRLDDDDL